MISFFGDDPNLFLWRRVLSDDIEKILPFFVKAPVEIGGLAAALGIKVSIKTLNSRISGLIKKSETGGYEIYVNNLDDPMRQRFTVSHEISHYLLHRSLIDLDGIEDSVLYRSKLSNKKEVEANKLASSILMPWPLVEEWSSKNLMGLPSSHDVELMASFFKVSRLAAGFRVGI